MPDYSVDQMGVSLVRGGLTHLPRTPFPDGILQSRIGHEKSNVCLLLYPRTWATCPQLLNQYYPSGDGRKWEDPGWATSL